MREEAFRGFQPTAVQGHLGRPPHAVEQTRAIPAEHSPNPDPQNQQATIKWLLFHTDQFEVVCYTAWRARIASFKIFFSCLVVQMSYLLLSYLL